LYNILPDAIGKLSSDNRVSAETFDSIMKYLFSFIQKERQSESLVEKLCLRFRTSNELQEWRCIALCLSLLTYNDKGIKKLVEYFKCYQDKLTDEEVFGSFNTIVSKTKKFAKQELKTALEEFEQKLTSTQKSQLEEEGDVQASSKPEVNTNKRARPVKARKGKNHRKGSSDDESEASDSYDEDEESDHKKKPLQKAKAPHPTRAKKQEANGDVEMLSVSEDESTRQVTGKKQNGTRRTKVTRKPVKKVKTDTEQMNDVMSDASDEQHSPKKRATKKVAQKQPLSTRPTRSTRSRVPLPNAKASSSDSEDSSGDDNDEDY